MRGITGLLLVAGGGVLAVLIVLGKFPPPPPPVQEGASNPDNLNPKSTGSSTGGAQG